MVPTGHVRMMRMGGSGPVHDDDDQATDDSMRRQRGYGKQAMVPGDDRCSGHGYGCPVPTFPITAGWQAAATS